MPPASRQLFSSHPGDSANSTGDHSANVASSESDSYEDVMSGGDDDEMVKSQWTARKKTPLSLVPNNFSTTKV